MEGCGLVRLERDHKGRIILKVTQGWSWARRLLGREPDQGRKAG